MSNQTPLESLRAQVEANTSISESAIALMSGLKTQLDAAIASGDMAQVQSLSDQLGTENQKLAEAITANTPTV